MNRYTIFTGALCFALTASVAASADAVDHQLNADFIAQFESSNFNRTPTTDYNAAGGGYYDPTGVKKEQNSSNFMEQRISLRYSAAASPDIKLVTAFELDYAYWGNNSHTVGGGSGGGVGADSVNLETKNLYLDYSPRSKTNLKLGMMPKNDLFKGVVFDTDMAGLLVTGTYGSWINSAGYFRLDDKGDSYDQVLGMNTRDLFLIDSSMRVSDSIKINAAYYFFRDSTPDGKSTVIVPAVPDTMITVNDVYGNPYVLTLPGTGSAAVTTPTYNDVKMHVLGLGAEYTSGRLKLNGFGIFQTGTNNHRPTTAFAANVGARLKSKHGPGTMRLEFLYVTGDTSDTGHSNAFYSVSGERGYFANDMAIIGRDKNALTTDNSLVFDSGNNGQGQIGGYLGYDRPFSPQFDMSFNVGFVAVAEETAKKPFIYENGIVTDKKNNSNFLGSELNTEANYRISDHLKASVRVAYAILGEYYKGVALHDPPMNLYDAKFIVKYLF